MPGERRSTTMIFEHSEGDEKSQEGMREMFGPQGVDHMIRQAISTCWMMLPKESKTVSAVETEIRRLVERALRDLKEDAQAFGIGDKA
jgi:hypothetical protein